MQNQILPLPSQGKPFHNPPLPISHLHLMTTDEWSIICISGNLNSTRAFDRIPTLQQAGSSSWRRTVMFPSIPRRRTRHVVALIRSRVPQMLIWWLSLQKRHQPSHLNSSRHLRVPSRVLHALAFRSVVIAARSLLWTRTPSSAPIKVPPDYRQQHQPFGPSPMLSALHRQLTDALSPLISVLFWAFPASWSSRPPRPYRHRMSMPT